VILVGPALVFVAFILILLAFLAPTVLFHGSVSLLSVASTNLTQAGVEPALFLGPLGSCSTPQANTKISLSDCTTVSLSPTYNTSVLQVPGSNSTAYTILSQPPATAPDFILLSIILTGLFCVGYIGQCIHHCKKTKIFAPFRDVYVASCGVLSFLTGLIPFIVMRMWFEKMSTDYNAVNNVEMAGQNGPVLQAAIGNGFTMAWVAYACYLLPLGVLFSRLSKTSRPIHVEQHLQQHATSGFLHSRRNGPNSLDASYNMQSGDMRRDVSYDVEK